MKLENLDEETLSKMLLNQIDLLVLGEGDVNLIERICDVLDRKQSKYVDYISGEKFLSIIEDTKKKYVTIIERKDKAVLEGL